MSLSKEQYDLLCKLSDKILLDERLTETTIAISWINVIRWHPEYLKQYQVLFKKTNVLQNIKQYVFRSSYYILASCYKVFRALLIRDFWKSSHKVHSKVDIVFISHLVNPSEYGQENDFYYGNLASSLHDKNINSMIVKIDHDNNRNLNLICKWNKSITPRIVLRKTLPFLDEIKIFINQRLEQKKIENIPCVGFVKNITSELSYQVVSPNTAATMRTIKQVQELLKKIKPRCIVTTFEGFAWERLVYSTAREIDENIKCIGYQHAAIFQLQHSIKIHSKSVYNPDIILASGNTSEKELNVIFENKIPIYLLGSPKRGGARENERGKRKVVCLVTPETFSEEQKILFSYSLACAKNIPSVQFIWRLHPKASFDDLVSIDPLFSDLPDNIILSNKTLADDIEKCSYILYRGSTSVVTAISSGIIPVYLRRDDKELDFNPIYNCKEVVEVTSVKDFQVFLKSNYESSLKYLINYGKDFYTKLDADALVRILKHI
jgi:hypothetical protein